MVGNLTSRRRSSTFPAATLLYGFLVFHLLNKCVIADVYQENSTTSNQFLVPKNSTHFENWLAERKVAYDNRMREVEEGIDVALESRLMEAEKNRTVITVRQDGTGDFETITDAVASIPDEQSRRIIVSIGPGVYTEKVTVNKSKPFVTFLGDKDNPPTVRFDGKAKQYGTWYSATVAVDSEYFMATNIIFENSAPMPAAGELGGQAVAMRISGDKAAFYNCTFLGYQDTLLDDVGSHFFENCRIQGSVDFIFGNGKSIYSKCEVISVAPPNFKTAITAHGRYSTTEQSGFSFVNCSITGTGKATLSRAWRESARVVFSYTHMGDLIVPQGWDDKGYTERQKTVYYAEYKCSGPGSNRQGRVSYGRELDDVQVQPFIDISFIHGRTWLQPPPSLEPPPMLEPPPLL